MTARLIYRGIELPEGFDPRVIVENSEDSETVDMMTSGVGNWLNGVDAALDAEDADRLGNQVQAIWTDPVKEYLKADLEDTASETRYYRSGSCITRYTDGESRSGETIYADDPEDVWEEIGGPSESVTRTLDHYVQITHADLPDHAKEA